MRYNYSMTQVPIDFSLPFVKKEQLSDDAWSFFFDRTAYPDLSFLPGQYVRMTLEIPQTDERGNSRFFSISSSPLQKEYLTISTRILKSAFKQSLIALDHGRNVNFFGPVGRFFFDPENIRPTIFLSGGIGITPFRSMLHYIAEKNLTNSVALFASFSRSEDVLFFDELSEITNKHQSVKSIYTVTQLENSHVKWNGETGRITARLLSKYCANLADAQYYISGPPLMVDAMLALVKEIGVPDEQVKKEKFIGY